MTGAANSRAGHVPLGKSGAAGEGGVDDRGGGCALDRETGTRDWEGGTARRGTMAIAVVGGIACAAAASERELRGGWSSDKVGEQRKRSGKGGKAAGERSSREAKGDRGESVRERSRATAACQDDGEHAPLPPVNHVLSPTACPFPTRAEKTGSAHGRSQSSPSPPPPHPPARRLADFPRPPLRTSSTAGTFRPVDVPPQTPPASPTSGLDRSRDCHGQGTGSCLRARRRAATSHRAAAVAAAHVSKVGVPRTEHVAGNGRAGKEARRGGLGAGARGGGEAATRPCIVHESNGPDCGAEAERGTPRARHAYAPLPPYGQSVAEGGGWRGANPHGRRQRRRRGWLWPGGPHVSRIGCVEGMTTAAAARQRVSVVWSLVWLWLTPPPPPDISSLQAYCTVQHAAACPRRH